MLAEHRKTIHFWLAVLVLSGSGLYLQSARRSGAFQVLKKALPIRKPLNDLDRDCLLPYQLVNSRVLPPESTAELGTEEYIEWTVRDGKAPRKWLRVANVSVSFYTGKQDRIPNVPEECFVQGAFSESRDDTFDWHMDSLGEEIVIRRLAFDPPHPTGKQIYVYYTIAVNGDYYAGRTGARIRMGDSQDTHLYYAKIQVSFHDVREKHLEGLDERAQSLLDQLLGELVEAHFPLRGWERGGPPTNKPNRDGNPGS